MYGILQTRAYRCLPRQGRRCMPERGRHGKAPCSHFAMSGVFDYPYTFISILLSVLLYIYIAILPYWCIDVLLYCLISTLLYICIVILFYISIVYNKAIYFSISIFLFPFLVFNLNFFSIGCAVNHHRQLFKCKGMAAQADTKHQSMLSLSAKIFCSRLPQSEIGYSTKILYRLFGLLPYWAAIL